MTMSMENESWIGPTMQNVSYFPLSRANIMIAFDMR